MSQIPLSLTFSEFDRKGLYLIFGDSTVLPLTESNVADVTRRFWEDPSKISPEVRKHANFYPCALCPEAGNGVMCYAIRPVLPFLENIDRYFSHDRVIAVYRGDEDQILHIAESDMQNALNYICMLSILYYCRTGMRYKKYYHGVIPIMSFAQAVEKIYLNIYWLHKGKTREISRFLKQFQYDISAISGNAMKRLELLCKKDALLNAFYSMHMAVDFLAMEKHNVLNKAFELYDEKEVTEQ